MEAPVIVIDPEVMSGTPCFRGTRVPFKNLMDYLEGGHSLGEFLRQFPTVTQEMAVQALEEAKDSLVGASSSLTRPAFLPNLEAMEVQPTLDQREFIRQAIEDGRFHREEEAIQEALSLWEERERRRVEFLATLDDARASLARGEGRIITRESMSELAEEVKARGRARLAAEQSTPR